MPPDAATASRVKDSMPAFNYRIPPQGQHWPHTWAVNGELVIALTQAGDIHDQQWNQFLQDIRTTGVKAVLGLSIGAVAVNSVQRKALSDATKDKILVAVLENRVTRGIITALGWIGLSIKAFGWDSLDKSYEYLAEKGIDVQGVSEAVTHLMKASKAPSVTEILSG